MGWRWLLRKLADFLHAVLGDEPPPYDPDHPCTHPVILMQCPSRCGVCGRLRDGSEDC